jgi:dienelactone hydrolase
MATLAENMKLLARQTVAVMVRRLALFVMSVALAGLATAARPIPPAFGGTDADTLSFATPGSLDRTETRYVVGEPVVLSGELLLPDGAGPFPVVVLAHGCGGRTAVDRTWAIVLRDWGYATFALDSFTGRNLLEVCGDATVLSGIQRIPDAYGALRRLATHPRLDARRAALMGFSHGGILTLNAATVWAKETYAPAGQPAFRAFLPFYPYCNSVYPERDHVSAPVRIHIGGADDWTPAASCVSLAESLKAAGYDVAITVYPGAYHGFDNPWGGAYMRLSGVDNGAPCVFRVPSILGPIPPRAEIKACLTKGATIGGDRKALEQARINVRAQLAELLK